MTLEWFFLGQFGFVLLEVILPPVVEILELEFFYLCFSFWNLFLNSFQAFSEVSTLLEQLIADLGFYTFSLRSLILESFMAVPWVYTLATVIWAGQLPCWVKLSIFLI